MVRLTHISDWPMHVAYWGTQWLLNISWLDPVGAIDSRRSQHVSKAGHLVMTAPLRPPASYCTEGRAATLHDGKMARSCILPATQPSGGTPLAKSLRQPMPNLNSGIW